MRLDHADYIKLLIESYRKKKASNELSSLLARSTPARIRRECINVFRERYEKRDENTLRAFFGPAENERKLLQSIEHFNTDKFRPLDKYLKGGTEKTEDINVELLAWLIDFKYRPYNYDMNVILNDAELSILGKSEETDPAPPTLSRPKETNEANGQTSTNSVNIPSMDPEVQQETENKGKGTLSLTQFTRGARKAMSGRAAVLGLIISLGGIFALWKPGVFSQLVLRNPNQGCMYWADDHYEKVGCNEETEGRLLLPFNENKMKNFRKITREDTITEWSIGRIYYLKTNNEIECFTTGGYHPVQTTRSLKKLSRNMFEKYILNNKNQNLVND